MMFIDRLAHEYENLLAEMECSGNKYHMAVAAHQRAQDLFKLGKRRQAFGALVRSFRLTRESRHPGATAVARDAIADLYVHGFATDAIRLVNDNAHRSSRGRFLEEIAIKLARHGKYRPAVRIVKNIDDSEQQRRTMLQFARTAHQKCYKRPGWVIEEAARVIAQERDWLKRATGLCRLAKRHAYTGNRTAGMRMLKMALANVPRDAALPDLICLKARQAETYHALNREKQALGAATEVVVLTGKLKRPVVSLKQGKTTYLYIKPDGIDEALASMEHMFTFFGKYELADRCHKLIRNEQFRENTLFDAYGVTFNSNGIDRAKALLPRFKRTSHRLEAMAMMAEHLHNAGDVRRAELLLRQVVRRATAIDDHEAADVLRHASVTLHKWDPASDQPLRLIRRAIAIKTRDRGSHLYTEPWMLALWSIEQYDEALDLVLRHNEDPVTRLYAIYTMRCFASNELRLNRKLDA